jgi:hypothetical protein
VLPSSYLHCSAAPSEAPSLPGSPASQTHKHALLSPPRPALPCPLQSGKLSLKAVQAFEPPLREAGFHLARSMDQLAGCIDGSVAYKE